MDDQPSTLRAASRAPVSPTPPAASIPLPLQPPSSSSPLPPPPASPFKPAPPSSPPPQHPSTPDHQHAPAAEPVEDVEDVAAPQLLPPSDVPHSHSSRAPPMLATSSLITDASQPPLRDMTPDLRHDLHAVAQNAVQLKPQPQPPSTPSARAHQEAQSIHAPEPQLSEQPALHVNEYGAAAADAAQHPVHDPDQPHRHPNHASPQIIPSHPESHSESQLEHPAEPAGHPAEPAVHHSHAHHSDAEANVLHKTEAQMDAHTPLSEHHAPQLAHEVSVSAAPAVAEFAVNRSDADDHTRLSNDFNSKPHHSPPHSMAVVHHRSVERSKRGSERYHASGEQLKTLIAAFDQNPTPDASTLSFISETIGMPMHNLVLWFKNRRARHKRSHYNLNVRGGKRSYVKSGIYSRNKRVKHALSAPTTVPSGGLTLPLSHGLSSISSPLAVSSIALPTVDPKNAAIAVAGRDIDELVKTGAPLSSRMKRPRFSAIPELVGDDNPCQGWTSEECHRRCLAFFERTTSITCPEQSKLVEDVSSEFFLSELQSGLTLVSAMQPLETSVGVMDAIMDKLPANGPRLSSGSKVLMREYLARIRTGNAEELALLEGATDAVETVTESHANEPQVIAPSATSPDD